MSTLRLLDLWSPKANAGRPIACLATTFTFDSDFFTEDCLARFLSLTSVSSEGDKISSICAAIEEYEKLAETRVSLLVDRSNMSEKRTQQWDLLPVHVDGGLLHAKTAILIWENSARIIVSSANLTAAGYRQQIENSLAFDIDSDSAISQEFLLALVAEIGSIVQLASPTAGNALNRAKATIELARQRVVGLPPDRTINKKILLAVARAAPGESPLDRYEEVWSGAKPLRAIVSSPFWDDVPNAPAISRIRDLLTGRPAHDRHLVGLAGISSYGGAVMAPPVLATQVDSLESFKPPDSERRTLHSKTIVLESDSWTAALVGSSNATVAGLGLNLVAGHRELNVWIGCPGNTVTAKNLRALVPRGSSITEEMLTCTETLDDEDLRGTPLPLGFDTCTLVVSEQTTLAHFNLGLEHLPKDWAVHLPDGPQLIDSNDWAHSGSPLVLKCTLPTTAVPAYFDVRWVDEGDFSAAWTANVEDPSTLPPIPEIESIPVSIRLAALASGKPLSAALEHEARRKTASQDAAKPGEYDPLRHFDSSDLLLQRMRRWSLALSHIQRRIATNVYSADALNARLNGPLGAVTLAKQIEAESSAKTLSPGEAAFLIAELALAIGHADWKTATAAIPPDETHTVLAEAIDSIAATRARLYVRLDTSLANYVTEALQEAKTCVIR